MKRAYKSRSLTSVQNLSQNDLIYLAGLLEGEGSFTNRTQGNEPRITLVMIDNDTIEKVAKLFGRAVTPVHTPKQKSLGRLPLFQTEVTGWAAIHLSKALYPYMSKRRRAQIAATLKPHGGIN